MSLTREEYLEYKRLCVAVDLGGNDGADIYDFECYAQHLEELHQQPLKELVEDYIVTHKDDPNL